MTVLLHCWPCFRAFSLAASFDSPWEPGSHAEFACESPAGCVVMMGLVFERTVLFSRFPMQIYRVRISGHSMQLFVFPNTYNWFCTCYLENRMLFQAISERLCISNSSRETWGGRTVNGRRSCKLLVPALFLSPVPERGKSLKHWIWIFSVYIAICQKQKRVIKTKLNITKWVSMECHTTI